MKDRTRIGQALGILSQRHHLDSAHAYAMLQRYARDQDSNLRDSAEDIVSGRSDGEE